MARKCTPGRPIGGWSSAKPTGRRLGLADRMAAGSSAAEYRKAREWPTALTTLALVIPVLEAVLRAQIFRRGVDTKAVRGGPRRGATPHSGRQAPAGTD